MKTEKEKTRARDCHATLDAIWRLGSGRIVAAVLHIVRDLAVAEELAQDASVRALEKWTDQEVPENPAGWLMTTARHRAIDALRRQVSYTGVRQQLRDEL